MLELLHPDWPAPGNISALSTTRQHGVSRPPWDSLNLAGHVGDSPDAVAANRRLLAQQGRLPAAPAWLDQVHGDVVAVQPTQAEADARYSRVPGEVCAVLTADCLPVLFCDRQGSAVAAAHAGWRGLAAGILERSVACFDADPAELLAWLGPAIGPSAFEVGCEVREVFVAEDRSASLAFTRRDASHWLADIYLLARQRLERAGVRSIYGGGYCTVGEQQRFFSFRRDGTTGRMASLIWINEVGS